MTPPYLPSDRPPPRRIDGPVRDREFLEDGTDVTRTTDRDLVLRAVNSTLRTEHAIGMLTGEVAQVRRDIVQLRDGRLGSIPDLADATARLADVVEEITDHGQQGRAKQDSDRVRDVVAEELDEKELRAWRDRKKAILDVMKAGAGVVSGAGLLELAHLLFGHW
jgi:hypothetical protein